MLSKYIKLDTGQRLKLLFEMLIERESEIKNELMSMRHDLYNNHRRTPEMNARLDELNKELSRLKQLIEQTGKEAKGS